MSREWVETHRDELSSIEVAFLAASEEAERQREQDELENERRLREAAEVAQEAERKRAEDAEAAAKRQKQLGRRFLVAAVVAGVLAATSVALVVRANKARHDADDAAKAATRSETRAIEARKRAEDQARIAESRRLAALSEAERGKRLDRAFLLAVEALRKESTTEARDSLFRALVTQPGIVSFLHADEGRIRSVAYSPDGKTLAAGYDGVRGGVVLWDAQRRTRLQAEPLPVAEGVVNSVAFSPDGKTLAAGYVHVGGSGVVLWDAQRAHVAAGRAAARGRGRRQ